MSGHTIHSELLKQERTYAVYTPPRYTPAGAPCGLLILFDAVGSQPDDLLPVPNILDYFIFRQKLPALVAVLVRQKDRMKEPSCSQPFADFIATELVPRLRADYHLSTEPSRTIIGGISQGGLMAAYCGYRHSEVFGNVLSLSGAFPWMPGLEDGQVLDEPGWLTREFVAGPRLPVRFYLAVGSFENYWPFSQIAETRRFRDVLRQGILRRLPAIQRWPRTRRLAPPLRRWPSLAGASRAVTPLVSFALFSLARIQQLRWPPDNPVCRDAIEARTAMQRLYTAVQGAGQPAPKPLSDE